MDMKLINVKYMSRLLSALSRKQLIEVKTRPTPFQNQTGLIYGSCGVARFNLNACLLPSLKPRASGSRDYSSTRQLSLFQWKNHCSGKSLNVSVADASNVKLMAECYTLIRQASMRGDNVGLDEFPLSISDLTSIVAKPRTKAFVFSDGDVIEAMLLVTPCPHSRSAKPTLCSLRMITSQHLQATSGKHFWPDFSRAVLEILKGHTGNQYSACVTDVFVTCVDVVLGLRQAGFSITACIPACGLMSYNRRCDYVSSYVMYAEICNDEPDQPVLQQSTSSNDEQSLRSITIRSLPYFPVTSLSLRTQRQCDNVNVTLRKLRNDEIPLFYETAKDAASDATSIGSYGKDEFTDLSYFAHEYVDNQYVTVIELSESSQTVGFMSFGLSTFSRSSRNLINDANLVLLREFRHNGWASSLLAFNASMSKDAGFLTTQGEAAVTNLGSIMSMLRIGCTSNGVLPKAIYFDQSGWTDLFLTYLYLDKFPSMLHYKTTHKPFA